ncbi:hypothetical protein ACCS76_37445, partial [Rhizobium ruizarguesonis]
MTQTAHPDSVLIVDLGSQVTQLIARRVREAGVYCEIDPSSTVEAGLPDRITAFGCRRWKPSSADWKGT